MSIESEEAHIHIAGFSIITEKTRVALESLEPEQQGEIFLKNGQLMDVETQEPISPEKFITQQLSETEV